MTDVFYVAAEPKHTATISIIFGWLMNNHKMNEKSTYKLFKKNLNFT